MGEFRYVGDAFLIQKGRQALAEAINEAAEDLVGKAQQVTPVDTGTLKASIHVDREASAAAGGATQMSARVATGGEANDYAIYVHEGTSRGVPAFKFLEGPLLEHRGTYIKFIRSRVAKAF